MMRPSLPATPVVAQAATTLLTQIMLPAAPPMFCKARTTIGESLTSAASTSVRPEHPAEEEERRTPYRFT